MAGEQLFSKPPLGARLNMAHPLALNLTGCWLFNEQMGLRAMDLSPYGNHGLLGGFPTNPRDTYGLVFDGTDGYIDCGNAFSLELSITQGLTMEFWLQSDNPNAGTWRGIMGRGNISSYAIRWRDTNAISLSVLEVGVGRDVVTTTKTSWTANQWYHIVYTYLSGSAKVFIDAVQDGTSTAVYTIDSTTVNLDIGRTGTSYVGASMALARIWKRALTADEVKALYISPYAPMGLKMFL